MFLVYVVIGALQMFFDYDVDDDDKLWDRYTTIFGNFRDPLHKWLISR